MGSSTAITCIHCGYSKNKKAREHIRVPALVR